MNTFLVILALTTVIAVSSALWTGHARLQRRLLPWTAGLLLGIAGFWILPEMAEDHGWLSTLGGTSAIVLLLGLIDRYVYPICPFCAAGMHSGGKDPEGKVEMASSRHHHLNLGWPFLLFGCLHVFCDGWTIALAQAASHSNSAAALSWGATVHKIPESVAIGFLAIRLTRNRKMAFAAIVLLQAVMAAGGFLAVSMGTSLAAWVDFSTLPACAVLLFFGLLALEQEWRLFGGLNALRTAAPGLLGCGLAALLSSLAH